MSPPADRMPEAWFNVVPRLTAPLHAPLHPATGIAMSPADMAPLLPAALVDQEATPATWVDIPGGVIDVLRAWRPTPLVRARRLELALGTPARIYFKDESGSPAGSHHPNTAVAQAFYNAREGMKRLVTPTGGGRWGAALALACALLDMECHVYMARSSFAGNAYGREMIGTWGGQVGSSPVDRPGDPGSYRAAAADAVRDAARREDTGYAAGSVLNHVLLHQTVIGLEAGQQLAAAGEDRPDVVIGGVGSDLAGIALPFVADAGVRLMVVEGSPFPSLTSPSIDAEGLRRYGDTPVISNLVEVGRIEAVAYPDQAVLETERQFAGALGPIPAPGTARAVRAAVDEALLAREEGVARVILFCWSGRGVPAR